MNIGIHASHYYCMPFISSSMLYQFSATSPSTSSHYLTSLQFLSYTSMPFMPSLFSSFFSLLWTEKLRYESTLAYPIAIALGYKPLRRYSSSLVPQGPLAVNQFPAIAHTPSTLRGSFIGVDKRHYLHSSDWESCPST